MSVRQKGEWPSSSNTAATPYRDAGVAMSERSEVGRGRRIVVVKHHNYLARWGISKTRLALIDHGGETSVTAICEHRVVGIVDPVVVNHELIEVLARRQIDAANPGGILFPTEHVLRVPTVE